MGSPKPLRFILCGPWMSVTNFMPIRPIGVEIFQSGLKWRSDSQSLSGIPKKPIWTPFNNSTEAERILSNFGHLPGKERRRKKKSVLCWEQAETRSQLWLWPLPSWPQANGSLKVYKQQAAEGGPSFYGVFPKEAELSSPQRDFTLDLGSSRGKKQIDANVALQLLHK